MASCLVKTQLVTETTSSRQTYAGGLALGGLLLQITDSVIQQLQPTKTFSTELAWLHAAACYLC